MSENIKIICRIRPLNVKVAGENENDIFSYPKDDDRSVCLQNYTYTFNKVFKHCAQQMEVYEFVSENVIDDVLTGFNRTILAYGQTASGKTYTMEGHLNDESLHGIIPRLITDLFTAINLKNDGNKYTVKVSNSEVYLDNIRDLLNTSGINLTIMEDRDQIPFIKNITEIFVDNAEETLDLFRNGSMNRKVGATNMNDVSSRSHSLFTIEVEQSDGDSKQTLRGKLFLVDLAGSESVAKSGSEGTLLEEAKKINKSLSELCNVMNALICQSSHIPYRNCKLTRLLKQSFGGNSKTTMIVCCSPAEYNLAETKSTLEYASRALSIKNNVTVNMEISMDEMRCKYNGLIGSFIKLEEEIKRWREGESVGEQEWYTDYKYSFDLSKSHSATKAISTPQKKQRFTQDSIKCNTPQSYIRKNSEGSIHSAGELFNYAVERDVENSKQKLQLRKLKEQLEEQRILNNEYKENFLRVVSEMKDETENSGENNVDDENASGCKTEFKIILDQIKGLKMQLKHKEDQITTMKDNNVETIKLIISEECESSSSIIQRTTLNEESSLLHDEIIKYQKKMKARSGKLKDLENCKQLTDLRDAKSNEDISFLQSQVKDLRIDFDIVSKKMESAMDDKKILEKEITDLKEREKEWNCNLAAGEIQSHIKSDLDDIKLQNKCITEFVRTIQEQIEINAGVVTERSECEREDEVEIASLRRALKTEEEKCNKMKKRLSHFNKDSIHQRNINEQLNETTVNLKNQILDIQEGFEKDKMRYSAMLKGIWSCGLCLRCRAQLD